MRKVLVSLMVLSLASALATAATTNPEGFEGYALTDDWIPTQAGEGWQFIQIHDVPGAVAQIVDDGAGGQVLETDNGAWLGLAGYPMWDADGPADADFAVTKTSFDIKPIAGTLGSEFHAKFTRYPDTVETYWQGTWEVGIRVGHYGEAGQPIGPVEEGTWNSLGTNVYLHTHQGSDQFIKTPIPGFGEGVWIVPNVTGTPGGITSEWWTMEVEEDNTTQETRARMYLRSTTPGDEDGWTAWQAHNPAIEYTGTEGQISGSMAGIVQMDNWSIIGVGEAVPECNPGDANNDLLVSADDYASVQGSFGNTGEVGIPGDANCDGLVSADDYASVQGNFGTTYGGAAIPEPATMLLLGAGALMLIKRKR